MKALSPESGISLRNERVILVHDWLTGMRGGEKCLEPACRRWPNARLYTLLHQRGSVSPIIEDLRPIASALNRLPRVEKYYRYLLPVMPFAASRRLSECDVVLSFSHCVAKSVIPPPGVPHICYCFTPMRYAWHMRESYFKRGRFGSLKAAAIDLILGRLREWDRRTAERVTHFVAISSTVSARIRECYGRDSVVIHPPVDTDFYTPAPVPREDYYLVVSALAPYKRFDLAVRACSEIGKKLIVIGSGQEAEKLRSIAGLSVEFLGWRPDEEILFHLRRCRALLFPAEEDFGIVPLEAQACGTPVIAFGRGGATETVRPLGLSEEPTGVFFDTQSVEAMIEAIGRFEREANVFDPRVARRHALEFRKERYEAELFGYVEQVMRGKLEVRNAA